MRKLLILFVIIIFAAIGAGVFFYVEKQQPKPITEETCDQMPAINIPYISLVTTREKDSCYNIVAVNNNNPSLCEKISNKDLKNSCFYGIAVSYIDENNCKNISEPNDSNAIKDQCFILTAIAKGDISLCSKNISDKNTIRACEDDVNLKCDPASEAPFVKYQCYFRIAVAKKDISFCDKIQDSSRDKAICYSMVGMYTKDVSVCNKIESDPESGYYYRDDCYRMWLSSFKKDPKICEKIVDVDSRDSCYLNIARFSPSVSLCNKIKNNTEGKSSCYALVARDKKDAFLCAKIEDGMSKKTCYVNVAVAKEDMSVCDNIVAEGDERTLCYGGGYLMLALLKKDVGFCDKIDTEAEFKNVCYVEVAAATQDKTICKKISGIQAKEAKEKCMAGKSELSGE